MRKLKFVLSALTLTMAIASLFSAAGCKKTYTTVVKDSVYYSPWIKLSMTRQTSNGDTAFVQDLTASKLTASIIRSGAVLSYLGSPSNGDTAIISASDYGLYQFLDVGLIEVQSYGSQNDFSYSTSGFLYRYVIIPGNVLSTTSLKDFSKDQLNKMKFTDIQQAVQ